MGYVECPPNIVVAAFLAEARTNCCTLFLNHRSLIRYGFGCADVADELLYYAPVSFSSAAERKCIRELMFGGTTVVQLGGLLAHEVRSYCTIMGMLIGEYLSVMTSASLTGRPKTGVRGLSIYNALTCLERTLRCSPTVADCGLRCIKISELSTRPGCMHTLSRRRRRQYLQTAATRWSIHSDSCATCSDHPQCERTDRQTSGRTSESSAISAH